MLLLDRLKNFGMTNGRDCRFVVLKSGYGARIQSWAMFAWRMTVLYVHTINFREHPIPFECAAKTLSFLCRNPHFIQFSC